MPRRPAPVQPKNRPTRKLSKEEAGAYGKIVQAHLAGDGDWTLTTVKALQAEANRLLGISQGKKNSEFRSSTPKREARMSTALMDRRFDAHGRLAS